VTDARVELRRLWRRSARYRPRTATGAIVVVTVVAYAVQLLTAGGLQTALQYSPLYSLPATGAPFEPWRMIPSALLHQPATIGNVTGLTHILFNMVALVMFGRPLEGVIGAGRLVVIYLIGALGGSVAVLYASFLGLIDTSTAVYGASGAVFGVLGAVAAVQRRLGVDVRALLVLIALNLAIGVVVPGVAWQAHVGGLVVGAVTGWVLITDRGPRRDARARWITAGIGLVLIVLAVLPALLPA